MHFDALALAYMTHELNQRLVPGRVQQVLLPAAQSIALEVYAHGERQWFLAEANPAEARVQLVAEKVRRGVSTETPLLQLLRKYVRDALLTAIVQPDAAERLLILHFSHREHGDTALIVELIGRATNLILARAEAGVPGRILDLLRRAPTPDPAGRVLMPGRTWTPPDPGNRLSPLSTDDAAWATVFTQIAASEQPLPRAVMSQFRGIAASQAQEIAWRAMGAVDLPSHEVQPLALAHALQALWSPAQSGDRQPGVWVEGDRVVGFSPWTSHLHDFSPRPTFSEALSEYYAAVAQERQEREQNRVPAAEPTASDGYAVTRAQIAAQIQKARKRTLHALGALANDEPAPGAAEQLRTQANWLLALHHSLAPNAENLVVETEEGMLTIALDPTRTPVEQAQVLFKRAAKAERAADQIPIRRATLQNDLAFLEQAESDLARAANQPEIEAVRSLLRESGLLGPLTSRGKPVRPAPSQPRRYRAEDGTRILVGRNARQNDTLTFTTARPHDLWLHVRGAPGSHVVIQVGGGGTAEETILLAAHLAAWHSDKRENGFVDVIVAERRKLTRPQGGRPGQVLVREEKVVRAPSDRPAIEEEG